jgi:hypothetical protein
METEEFKCRLFYMHEEKANVSNLMSMIKSKCESQEEINRHLKVEADQKLKYQNDYNELMKQ